MTPWTRSSRVVPDEAAEKTGSSRVVPYEAAEEAQASPPDEVDGDKDTLPKEDTQSQEGGRATLQETQGKQGSRAGQGSTELAHKILLARPKFSHGPPQLADIRFEFAIDSTADLRYQFLQCFVGEAESLSWPTFICHCWYSCYYSSQTAVLVAAVHVVQSIMVIFPPASVASATTPELVLPPLILFALIEPGLTGLSWMFQCLEEEEAVWAARTCGKMAASALASYGCFVGVRLVSRSAGLSPGNLTIIELLTLPSIISVNAHLGFILAGRRRCQPWSECFRAWRRGCAIFAYVIGLVSMLALNSFVLAKSTVLRQYMGFILVFEKQFLKLLANLSMQNAPCGFPEFLISLGIHFEMDTNMMSALGIAAASTPLVVVQHLCLDALIFVLNSVKLSRGRRTLTLQKVQQSTWCQRSFAFLAFRSFAFLFPSHLYVADSIFLRMCNMAQISACLWVLAILWIMTLVQRDGAPLKVKEYFLPFGSRGLEYLACKTVFAFLQSIVYDVLLVKRRMKVAKFWHIQTLGWKKTLYHVMTWSYSSWTLAAMAFIGWWADP